MPNMYHPTLPNTYDGVPVTRHTFEVVWSKRGWRLAEDDTVDDQEVTDLLAAVAMTQSDEEE